jgi:hypothetical protein
MGGIELEGDTSALIELFDAVEVAVVIDAVRSGALPGTVHRFDPRWRTLAVVRLTAKSPATFPDLMIDAALAILVLSALPSRSR